MEQLEKVSSESAFSLQNFEHAQRVAKMLSASDLIPDDYKNKVQNVMIAMEMSNRMNISPLMVMQNLFIVKGKPGWSGKFVIGIINNSRRFASELKFESSGEGDEYGYIAKTVNKDGSLEKEGTKITMKMVKAEGWLDKQGSKWKTMPEQMFKYRAASFFGSLHCPDLLMGMQTADEVIDTSVTIIEEISKEQLQTLLDNVIGELNKSEFDNATRIIQNNETASFSKLHKLLISKNGSQDKNQ